MRRQATMWLLVLGVACGPTSTDDDPAGAPSMDEEEGESYSEYDDDAKADGFTPPNGALVFDGACSEGESIVIAAVGDVLLHARLQRQAWTQNDRFVSLWRGVADLLQGADITYANLEGPTAAGVNKNGQDVSDPGDVFDDYVYTSYPMFNYHPALTDDLVASGVDVVSTANNHSLDRLSLGVDRTLDALDRAGLPHTGTRRRGASADPWHTTTQARGITIAWVACTYATNGIRDRYDQVLRCFQSADQIEALVSELARRTDVDGVIVTPHFGVEYDANPNADQVDFAHRMLDAGAIAIIGSHPHVLQPWERYVTADGRETFALYSLGNFVSGQNHLPRRSTLLLYLGLTRRHDGTLVVNGARFVPLHASRRDDVGITVEAIDRVGGLADSRALTVGMFGGWNLEPPTGQPETDPQCDPEWSPPPAPHPHDGWIGGSCDGDASCGGATCETSLPGGLCTQECTYTCPDMSGRATTFCVDLGLDGTGSCVARCGNDAECREGYECATTARYGDPTVTRSVCVPAS